MKKTLWYAVSKMGQGNIFTSMPERNDLRGIWTGEIHPCFTIAVLQLESEGFVLPNISWKDEAVKIMLEIEIEK